MAEHRHADIAGHGVQDDRTGASLEAEIDQLMHDAMLLGIPGTIRQIDHRLHVQRACDRPHTGCGNGDDLDQHSYIDLGQSLGNREIDGVCL